MNTIELHESGMRICFRINDDKTVELVDFSAREGSRDLPALEQGGCMVPRLHQLVALQLTGESATDIHDNKHNTGSESARMHYDRHTLREDERGQELTIFMTSEHQLRIAYTMRLFRGVAMVQVRTKVTNEGAEPVGIDYTSSFYYGGLCHNGGKRYYEKSRVMVPYNSWANEAQWTEYDIQDLGLTQMPVDGYNLPDRGSNRFCYGNVGSWSTGEHLPIGILKDQETGEIYYSEIEHSGSWEVEYGSDAGQTLYVALLGPSNESSWWKSLQPGESYETVPSSFGVCCGNESDAFAQLTKLRRAIRRPNADDERCSVVFNDYMNCLMGDPTTEREKRIMDYAAELGCEYYCMDCGWYDDGPWWEGVGEWKESQARFPGGMKEVCDYAREKGLKMGLWLEIESMGVQCRLAQELPDDWFICTHGRRRIENRRYLLDFRNPQVQRYCAGVVDRLIADYGVSFFKIDYNVTTGPGSDIHTDSMGAALQAHYEALYDWIRAMYQRHPDLVVEACSSGAQRMDYGILSLHSLQSTSDQTDYILNSYIAANVASAVTPEQGGMWVYPYVDDREHVIYNMVNGLLLRPYISGLIWDMSEENLQLLREGIALYKDKIRRDLPAMTPFWPQGMNRRGAKSLSYGVRNAQKAYLAVFAPGCQETAVDLSSLGFVTGVKVIYPVNEACQYALKGTTLQVTMPQEKAARLFELTL